MAISSPSFGQMFGPDLGSGPFLDSSKPYTSSGITWSPASSSTVTHVGIFTSAPERNSMNVSTCIVRTKAGWLGQIVVNGSIVWESSPRKTGEKAKAAADKRVAAKTVALFT